MKNLLIVLVIAALVYAFHDSSYDALYVKEPLSAEPQPDTGVSQASLAEQKLSHAFETKQSNLQLAGQGVVVRLLADDLQGSRHQRFILQLSSGQTLLIAHNIDLAPRIDGLREGDSVSFYGEYEWNPKGGVIHWTHHDPKGRHEPGWLKHNGRTYQ